MKDNQINKHVLSLLVDNEAGILARIVGMFSGRGYNIDSLSVTEVDAKKKLSRITIVTHASKNVVEQIEALIAKMIPVHAVTDLTSLKNFVEREMVLVKLVSKGEGRVESLRLADAFRARVVDATNESLIFELTGKSSKVAAFVELMRPLGMLEMVASGVVGIVRGKELT